MREVDLEEQNYTDPVAGLDPAHTATATATARIRTTL